MGSEIGKLVEGKVTGITKFGAFVQLPEGKSGLIHISELADCYVSDVHEYLEMGQTVKVMVLSVSPEGKINLSLKRAKPAGQNARHDADTEHTCGRAAKAELHRPDAEHAAQPAEAKSENDRFEEKLKKFMQESDSRLASNPMYSERKKKNRRR